MVFIPSNSEIKEDSAERKSKIFVVKRDGRKEPVLFDKITSRIQKLCYGLDLESIDPARIALKVINGLYSGVSTVELDNIAAGHAIKHSDEHQDYGVLAARIEISNLQKETKKSFSDVVEDLYHAGNKFAKHPKMDELFYNVVKGNEDALNSAIIYDRDFSYSYFGMKALQEDFLKKINGKVVERPQHMHMRIAVSIHGADINSVIQTYNILSERLFMYSPTTMRNAGYEGQLLSEYSLTMKGDSIEGIYDSVKDCGDITRFGGSVGLNVTCIRSTGSYIAGTNGTSNGLTPMLRVFNRTACYSIQGGESKISPITIYLEPWHPDIYDFIALRKTSGKDEQRARNLSYGLLIPDLFMKRVEENGDWSLMCPHDCDRLQELGGDEFEELYHLYEKEGRFVRQVKARNLWYLIIESQIVTGGPAMLFKENCLKRSTHNTVGKILSSSFNGELVTFTKENEAVGCGSGMICLDSFVQPWQTKTFDFGLFKKNKFDFKKLGETVKVAVRSLDKMIEVNHYPAIDAERGTKKHRPMAIGVQGLADAIILLGFAYESEEAKHLNQLIFETIYLAALESSCELAQELGPHHFWDESVHKNGAFQFDLWDDNIRPTPPIINKFKDLKEKIKQVGLRNSMLVACVPSEVTAKIHGCSPGTEVLESNLEQVTDFESNLQLVNKHLLTNLSERGLWNEDVLAAIKNNNGSVQNIDAIPEDVKELHKTVWEIMQKDVLLMALIRGPFIDQSQSIDIYLPVVNYGKLTSMHFFAWKEGLKTGMVHLHAKSQASSSPKKAGEEPIAKTAEDEPILESEDVNEKDEDKSSEENEKMSAMVCSLENKDDCMMCGS